MNHAKLQYSLVLKNVQAGRNHPLRGDFEENSTTATNFKLALYVYCLYHKRTVSLVWTLPCGNRGTHSHYHPLTNRTLQADRGTLRSSSQESPVLCHDYRCQSSTLLIKHCLSWCIANSYRECNMRLNLCQWEHK